MNMTHLFFLFSPAPKSRTLRTFFLLPRSLEPSLNFSKSLGERRVFLRQPKAANHHLQFLCKKKECRGTVSVRLSFHLEHVPAKSATTATTTDTQKQLRPETFGLASFRIFLDPSGRHPVNGLDFLKYLDYSTSKSNRNWLQGCFDFFKSKKTPSFCNSFELHKSKRNDHKKQQLQQQKSNSETLIRVSSSIFYHFLLYFSLSFLLFDSLPRLEPRICLSFFVMDFCTANLL